MLVVDCSKCPRLQERNYSVSFKKFLLFQLIYLIGKKTTKKIVKTNINAKNKY